MPPARPPESELAWSYFKGSGPGGQHRNKVETGVRLTHTPTGITVSATERRSRSQNREAALKRLEILLERSRRIRKKRRPTRPTKASRERRIKAKRVRSRIKAARRPPGAGDY